MAKTVQIRGLDEIERRLKALPEKLRRKAIRGALQDGMEPVRVEAALRAPERTPTHGWLASLESRRKKNRGHLKDNIASKVTVGAKAAQGRIGCTNRVRHAHLVEFGTDPHDIKMGKRTWRHRGARKQPFMRPAFDAKSGESVEIITSELAQAVEELI